MLQQILLSLARHDAGYIIVFSTSYVIALMCADGLWLSKTGTNVAQECKRRPLSPYCAQQQTSVCIRQTLIISNTDCGSTSPSGLGWPSGILLHRTASSAGLHRALGCWLGSAPLLLHCLHMRGNEYSPRALKGHSERGNRKHNQQKIQFWVRHMKCYTCDATPTAGLTMQEMVASMHT